MALLLLAGPQLVRLLLQVKLLNSLLKGHLAKVIHKVSDTGGDAGSSLQMRQKKLLHLSVDKTAHLCVCWVVICVSNLSSASPNRPYRRSGGRDTGLRRREPGSPVREAATVCHTNPGVWNTDAETLIPNESIQCTTSLSSLVNKTRL